LEITRADIEKRLLHFFEVKIQKITKRIFTINGQTVVKLMMPKYLMSEGFAVEAYRHINNHTINPMFIANKVWLNKALMNRKKRCNFPLN
jgi:hypothetical protein